MRRVFVIILVISIALLGAACDNSRPANPAPATTNTPASSAQNPPAGTDKSNSTSRSVLTNTPASKNPEIRLGQVIPEITTNDVKGEPTTVASRADKKGELVIVYAPGCHVCHDSMPRWITLYNQFFTPRNIPFIALSVQGLYDTNRSIQELSIPFKVVVMPDVDNRFGYSIPDVPTTLAIGDDGTIKGIWVGKLSNDQLAEVIKIFCPECNVNVTQKS